MDMILLIKRNSLNQHDLLVKPHEIPICFVRELNSQQFGKYIWEIVPGWWFQPLWKIWVRQLGWWHSQNMEKKRSKPATSDIVWYYLLMVCIQIDWIHYNYIHSIRSIYIYIYMSDRQNLNWKMRSSGQSYRFWEFTISFYSISWLHHLHPLANCVRKAFLHLHFSVWSMFDLPALSFAALQLYGMVWCLSTQLQITVAPSFLKFRNKFEFSCSKKSGWALTATCSMPFIHSPASG